MNSWLGFSLSPEELSSQAQSLDGAQAVSGECVDLPPGSTSEHYGIMEVFNSGHQHQDHFSMNGMEQFMNVICNQNMCNLGNKLGGQSYDNQQYLSQCNNVSLHSQSLRNPSDYVFSDGGEGGSLNGCGGKSSVGNDNTEIVSSGIDGQNESNELMPKKTVYIFGGRTSTYRGVARHRWSGRYEAHLWDNSHRREGQTRKGRQVYLGGYVEVEKAARAYDLAALKYWGTATTTNFPISNYEKELEEMKNMTRQEYVASLRRNSSGFSRGASIYRGVTRQHQHGRWIARVGRCAGNKELYLGLFNTQEEAAEAYDIAVIKVRGRNSVTNFDKSRYDVKRIMDQSSSTSLPIGAAKRLKENEQKETSIVVSSRTSNDYNLASQLTDCNSNYYGSRGWAPCQEVQSLSVQEREHDNREHDNVGAHHGQSFQDLSNTQNLFEPAGLGQNFMGHSPTAFGHISNLDPSVYFDGGGAAANYVTAFAVPFSAKMDEQSGEGRWGKTMI